MQEERSDCLLVLEDKDIMVIMDLYPATSGHLLILPKKHIETIYEIPLELSARIMATAVTMAKTIKDTLSPEGLNLVQANGDAAGQTIHHFHLHLVPRYKDDPVRLHFGHGDIGERVDELKRIASLLKTDLNKRI
jgi:histidine triad (HIT) family protein